VTAEAEGPGKLLLVDGHSIAFRAFFALPLDSFATSTGQPTNAVYGFVAMLIGLLREERPTHLAVAFDVSRTTFRTALYPDYKATRSATPPEFIGQVDLIKEVLTALRASALEVVDYEADDIIATLASQASQAGFEVVICSGDRDTFQLVDQATTVLYPRRGTSDLARMTPAAVEEKYGVTPQRYPELAALVGESSDNLPGVPGVGPKTAAKWLAAHDGLDNLLDQADQVGGKAGQTLRQHLDQVRRNRRLNALVRDLDLPLGLSDLARRPWDAQAVATVFDALQFRVLRQRLNEIGPAAGPAPEPVPVRSAVRLEAGQVAGWLERHGRTERTAWSVRGRADGDVEALALAAADDQTAWIEVHRLEPADDRALADWLGDPTRPKVGHACKPSLRQLWGRGWDLASLVSDTELAAYLVRPDQRGYDLADLVQRYLGRDLTAQPDRDDHGQPALDFGADPGLDDPESALAEVGAVLDLSRALDAALAEAGASQLMDSVELPLQRILARMEETGVAVDVDRLEALWQDFDRAVRRAEQDAHGEVGHAVNLASPKQLQVVLFDELDMPKTRKLKTGHSTDAEALEGLYAKTGHPFLAHLLAYRDAIRLRQTIEGLTKTVADDGRVHTTYLQTVAATGRLSSIEPNLQNIPIRTAAGRQIRQAFVPGAGFEALMTADYSQIEMRVMADASGDQDLIEAFRGGLDFHAVMAGHVFGVEPDQVTPQQRARVKAVNYGLAYGLSSYGLSTQLGVSVGEAQRLMDDYFARFGAVRDYLRSLVEQARQTGFTETLLGRRRYLPDLTSTNRTRREMAERMALNAPMQGSAADIIKLAMIKVSRRLAESGLRSRLLLQVHDELVFEVAPGEAEALEDCVRTEMGRAADLTVPLDVSVGIGPDWERAAH
jgi:DNA polymerase-1